MLGNHAVQEQVRADLALLEWRFISREVQNSRRTALVRIPDSIGQFGTSERCQNGTQGRTDDCIPWSSIL